MSQSNDRAHKIRLVREAITPSTAATMTDAELLEMHDAAEILLQIAAQSPASAQDSSSATENFQDSISSRTRSATAARSAAAAGVNLAHPQNLAAAFEEVDRVMAEVDAYFHRIGWPEARVAQMLCLHDGIRSRPLALSCEDFLGFCKGRNSVGE
ncbi:hypothetical protein ANO11243_077920 [Dothideomycetidae sp. 11243]|nr:hypothetical protein ANO11243_077920 [fungal sp. No.11243]